MCFSSDILLFWIFQLQQTDFNDFFFYFEPKKKLVNTRTLPHPRHNSHVIDPRARDDQMLGKGYLPSPSPALPLDGSYYNMNIPYPPMV